MRELALTLKKKGLDVNHFSSSVRLKKVLDRIGFPEEKLESLLEEIHIYSFQLGIDENEFLSKTDGILQTAYESNIPISDVLKKLAKRQRSW